MRLKRVTLRGFRCFGEAVTFSNFSPERNCILGLNGSGKSTFISAIEFLLLEDFAYLSDSHRASLLHQGPNPVTTAFVEAVFDNKTRLLPIDKDEIILRRSIGLQKDEYFIDRKHSSRSEVVNLFEAAGLDLKQGLFIVKQGKVKDIAEMKDESRLFLVHEVSGINSFEQQKKESEKLLDVAKMRLSKIHESIEYIEKRIEILNAEAEELRECEKLEDQARALKMLIFEENRESADEEIRNMEEERIREYSVVQSLREELDEVRQKVSNYESKLLELREEASAIQSQITKAEYERTKGIRKKARAESVKPLSSSQVQSLVREKENIEKGILRLRKSIESEVTRGFSIGLPYDITLNPDATITFSDQIKEKISLDQAKTRQQKMHQMEEEINKELEEIASMLKEAEYDLKKVTETMDFVNQRKIRSMDEKKAAWREESIIRKRMTSLETKLAKYESRAFLSENLVHLRRLKVPGFHGILGELIEWPDSFDAAIETSSRGKLLFLVAQNTEAAESIIKQSKGRVSIMLLDDIKYSKHSPSSTETRKPIIDFIERDSYLEDVVRAVFGNVVVCPTIDEAHEASRETGCIAVCLTGDIVYPGGSISGGYRNPKTMCAVNIRKVKELTATCDEASKALNEINRKVTELESKIENDSNEISELSNKQKSLHIKIENLREKYSEYELKAAAVQNAAIRADQLVEDLINEPLSREREDVMRELYSIQGNILTMKMQLSEMEQSLEALNKALRDSEEADRILKEAEDIDVTQLDTEIEKLEESLGTLRESRREIESLLGEQRKRETFIKKRLSTQQILLERLTARVLLLTQKRDEATKQASSLILTPSSYEVESRRGLSHSQLMDELKVVEDHLSRYRHVNRKADDQYRQFKHQRESLREQVKELESNASEIETLINTLEGKKEDATLKYLERLSNEFRKLFKILFPNNEASLSLKREGKDFDDFFDDQPGKMVGLGIRIDGVPIEQLSGGQKTLVAIALLIAFQIIDPVPFYFFDEIDADLDHNHRQSVARLIWNLSTKVDDEVSSAQFFYTTFKEELFEISSKFYGIVARPEGSDVREISEEEGRSFIKD